VEILYIVASLFYMQELKGRIESSILLYCKSSYKY